MKRTFRLSFYVICLLIGAFVVSWLIFMPNGQERGAWRAETGGVVLELTPLKATMFSETAHSCHTVIAFPAHMKLVEMLEGATVGMNGAQLELAIDGTLNTQRFDRLDALPENCTAPDPASASARDVFDAAWTAMDEHYAFFDLHGVDWAARRALAPAPDARMDDAQLEDMLLAMTAGLDDGHVHFGSDTRGYRSPAERPGWIPEGSNLNRDMLRQIAIANAGATITKSQTAPIFYGLREDGIGYIMLREMDVDVPIGGRSMDAMATAFANVLADLDAAKALIIDIRYNPGGSDTVSFGLAGHFIEAPLPVFTKTTRIGTTQTAPFTAILEPQGDAPDPRPVILMTSKLTGSAAEILTLAMREIPQVTTLGEPTSGGLSDVMGFTLPNGWGLGLSNQTYLTMNGDLFEKIGVPPDVPVPFETAPFLDGKDPVLNAAIAEASKYLQ
ncbi:S41 family peptidase [Yoonia sp. SS1-5]|uniref:S41 family peptidase n=1 Tax=Yoonia rhodophyticola TaxID=3137370 RepID=A0AAN0MJJ6_9RHOB